jgi:hypothetical protein
MVGALHSYIEPRALNMYVCMYVCMYVRTYVRMYDLEPWALFNYKKPRPPTDWADQPGVQTTPDHF